MFPQVNTGGNRTTFARGHTSTKPNMRLSDSFIQQQLEANRNSSANANQLLLEHRLSKQKSEQNLTIKQSKEQNELNEDDLFSSEDSLMDQNLDTNGEQGAGFNIARATSLENPNLIQAPWNKKR